MFFRSQSKTEQEAFRAEIDTKLRGMAQALKGVLEETEALDSKLERLRGVVYGRNLHKQPIAEDEPEPAQDAPKALPTSGMSKAELRRYLTQTGRIVPGQPTNHSE